MLRAIRDYSTKPDLGTRNRIQSLAAQTLRPIPYAQPFATGTSAFVCTMDLEQTRCSLLLTGLSDGLINVSNMHFKDSVDEINLSVKTYRGSGRPLPVETVQWYPVDPGIFTSSASNGEVTLWDVNAGAVVFQISTGSSTGVVTHRHSPNMPHVLALSTTDNVLAFADLRQPRSVLVDRKRLNNRVISLCWRESAEMQLLTGDVGGYISLWDIRSSLASPVQYLNEKSGRNQPAHDGAVKALLLIPDISTVVSLGSEGLIQFWTDREDFSLRNSFGKGSIPDYQLCHDLRDVPKLGIAVAQTASPKLLFVPCKNEIKVLRIGRNLELASNLKAHCRGSVICCAYDRVCCRLYSSGTDHNSVIWMPFQSSSGIESKRDTADRLAIIGDDWSSSDDE